MIVVEVISTLLGYLSVEIKKDHLIFGNVYKVVDVLCHT